MITNNIEVDVKVKCIEALGYDIEITYVKRKKQGE